MRICCLAIGQYSKILPIKSYYWLYSLHKYSLAKPRNIYHVKVSKLTVFFFPSLIICCLHERICSEPGPDLVRSKCLDEHICFAPNFGTVQLGPIHNLGPGPGQILFRTWFGTNIPSKQVISVQRRINIYF